MKAGGVIHPALLSLLATLGHTDELLICDAGYPIPAHIPRIDLAYRPGHPPFLDVLGAIAQELELEGALIAEEASIELGAEIDRALAARAERIPHTALKERAQRCRGAVRTGEYTRYANVILIAGVAFP